MIARSTLKREPFGVEQYAPRFRVSARGANLEAEVLNDVLQVRVTLEKDNLTSYSLTLNNWQEDFVRLPRFKYSDSDTFNIGTELRIEMGYGNEMLTLVSGPVTSLSPSFPESGTPTLEVGGKNPLFRLKNSKPKDNDCVTFKEKEDWEIASEIAMRNEIPIEVTKQGPKRREVIQKRDQDEATFLLDLAKRIEFDLFMLPDQKTGVEKLYFVKPQDGRDARPVTVFEYTWGENLIEFTPKLSVEDQVSAVTVRGWDPRTKQTVQYRATAQDLPVADGAGNSGATASMSASPRGKEDVIVDASVMDIEEAKKLAISRLTQSAYRYKTGSGRVMGEPKMRPGDNLQLRGIGKRFSGLWHVVQVDHSFGSGGFITSFQVEKLKELES